MRLTVVTASFNLIDEGREETFRQAVQSVRDQTHGDVEHLVIDGGSKDGTVEMLQDMKADGSIADFISKPDSGIFQAMNRGADLATGDYILYLNSDDFYHRAEGLAEVAAAAQQSQPDFICSDILLLDTPPPRVSRVSKLYYRILVAMPFDHQGMAVRRDVFQELGGFDEDFQLAADFDLIQRLFLRNATSAVLDKPFVTFRLGGASADKAAVEAEVVRVFQKNYGHLASVPDVDWREAIGRRRCPRPILLKILGSPAFSLRMKAIALFHLIKGLRAGRDRRQDP
jgi:glycosyltransferase involved in cell wall biosynthesis